MQTNTDFQQELTRFAVLKAINDKNEGFTYTDEL